MRAVEIAPEHRGALRYIADNMREWDRREIFATRWDDDPIAFADEVLAVGRFGWICGLEEPIAAVGAVPLWPGVWSVYAFATDNFHKIGLSLTKLIVRGMIPTLAGEMRAHRAECRSMAGHDQAQDWLTRSLGFHVETRLAGYGRNGEDFLLMTRGV